MQKTTPLQRTIQQVLTEFANARRDTLDTSEHHAYRRVLFFLELCINNYGHRNLDEPDRVRFEERCHGGEDVCFFELFGPRMLLPELDFFAHHYVRNDVFTSERIERKAPEVVADLEDFLVERGYVGAGDLASAELAVRERTRLERIAKRAAGLLRKRSLAVDPSFFTTADYLEVCDGPITRIDPGRLWLLVYPAARTEVIGPLSAPVAATNSLREGWSLNGSVARVRGRWHLTRVESVYPRVFGRPVCARRG